MPTEDRLRTNYISMIILERSWIGLPLTLSVPWLWRLEKSSHGYSSHSLASIHPAPWDDMICSSQKKSDGVYTEPRRWKASTRMNSKLNRSSITSCQKKCLTLLRRCGTTVKMEPEFRCLSSGTKARNSTGLHQRYNTVSWHAALTSIAFLIQSPQAMVALISPLIHFSAQRFWHSFKSTEPSWQCQISEVVANSEKRGIVLAYGKIEYVNINFHRDDYSWSFPVRWKFTMISSPQRTCCSFPKE